MADPIINASRIDIGTIAEYEVRLRDTELENLEAYRKGLAPAPVLYKAEGFVKANDRAGEPPVFVASEESEDRLGDVVSVDGWDTKNYLRNPVFMFNHQLHLAPLGTIAKLWSEGKQLLAIPRWDDEDPLAAFIKGKYERKVMRAVSVGFRPIEFEEREIKDATGAGRRAILFKKQELLEISAVMVPAHPRALQKMMAESHYGLLAPGANLTPIWSISYSSYSGTLAPTSSRTPSNTPIWSISYPPDSFGSGGAFGTIGILPLDEEVKGAIPYKQTPKADRGLEWDAAAELRKADDVAAWRAMHAWVDSSAPENKTSYKLPHHRGDAPHAVVFRGVSAAIGALNGARGGTNIPDADRGRVYAHLAHHIRDFGEEPSPLKSLQDIAWEQAALHASNREKLGQAAELLRQVLDLPADQAAGAAKNGDFSPVLEAIKQLRESI